MQEMFTLIVLNFPLANYCKYTRPTLTEFISSTESRNELIDLLSSLHSSYLFRLTRFRGHEQQKHSLRWFAYLKWDYTKEIITQQNRETRYDFIICCQVYECLCDPIGEKRMSKRSNWHTERWWVKSYENRKYSRRNSKKEIDEKRFFYYHSFLLYFLMIIHNKWHFDWRFNHHSLQLQFANILTDLWILSRRLFASILFVVCSCEWHTYTHTHIYIYTWSITLSKDANWIAFQCQYKKSSVHGVYWQKGARPLCATLQS